MKKQELISLVKKLLKSSLSEHREDGIEILHHAEIRTNDLDDIVCDLLFSDPSRKVRIAAIRFISEAKDKKFENVLKKCLSEYEDKASNIVKTRAFIGLEEINRAN